MGTLVGASGWAPSQPRGACDTPRRVRSINPGKGEKLRLLLRNGEARACDLRLPAQLQPPLPQHFAANKDALKVLPSHSFTEASQDVLHQPMSPSPMAGSPGPRVLASQPVRSKTPRPR